MDDDITLQGIMRLDLVALFSKLCFLVTYREITIIL